ncbi:muscarinic acetylcholine receptor M5-like [Stylophora pistillata]|uniref:Beta-1 adrenergic receptor n=1 Tax=Stylophora pistillata TaxID=50429 RepID=A0A2B4RR50_STYPI|nr:muscarinic acetylcholine receptor M5-like [Stylophora pistillata]PFX19030.1 Beta-1 adrenergic receptor [Stylophora pistillata]
MAQFEAQEHNVTGQIMTTRSNEPASKGWQAFQVIFWTWLTVATVIGNSLVLLCIALKKRRNSSMFKFYGSLALGDLIVGIFCAPLLLAAACHRQWNMGNTLCYAYTTVLSLSVNVSIMTLFLISLDRLNSVSRPFQYRAKETFTQQWAVWLILFTWFHSIFWAAAPLLGWGEIIKDKITNSCKPNWSAKGLKNVTYSMGLAAFPFAIPVLSMIVMYIMIYRRSKVSNRFIRDRSQTLADEEKKRRKQQNAILRTVLVVVGMFVLCWLPYTISTTFKLFFRAFPPMWLVHLGLMLATANSAVNPAIYSAFDRSMRDEFKRILLICRKKRDPLEEDGVRSRRTSSNLATWNNTITRVSDEAVNKIISGKDAKEMNGNNLPGKQTMTNSYNNMIELFVKDIAQKGHYPTRETWV